MRRIVSLVLGAMVFTGLGIALGVWLSGGSTLISIQTSPDRHERVELYGANRWQTLVSPEADLLGYARLVDARGETLGTSGPFELSLGGEVIWARDRVQVSSSAVYDRATGRWTVLQ